MGPRAVTLQSQTGFAFHTQRGQTGSQMFFDKSLLPLLDAQPLTVMLMLERHKYSVLSTAQHPQLYTPHTSLHRLSHAHTTPVTATHTGTHAHSHRPPAATCRNTALPPAHRSSSSSDTSPRGPMSVELSRPSQNTQDLMVAETPRLHDAHLPGVSPFRGAGSGRRQPGQGSTLSPSDSADSESGHLPLTEPQTFPCTPDPYPGLADDAPC